MKITCHNEMFDRFPEASIHGVVFECLDRFSNEHAALWRERAQVEITSSGLTLDRITEHPAVKEWRAAYQVFGLKPSKYRSSVEQLYRRALKEDLILTPLASVNIYCYVSVINAVPMGGYDLSKVRGDITVRGARHGEQFTGIGEGQSLTISPGVVVYSDNEGIVCWGWNYRDANRTSLDDGTRQAIFFADSSIRESRVRACEAIRMLSEIFLSAGCVSRGSFSLDNQTRVIELTQ